MITRQRGLCGDVFKIGHKKKFATNCFNLSPSRIIPGTNKQQTHVLLADGAFSLTPKMLNTYSQIQAKHDKLKAI